MTATLPTAVEAPSVPDTTPPTRLRASRPDLLLCGAVLVAILLVQGWNTTGFPALSDDEGTYLAQAWAVQEGKGLAHYTYWYDHPPLGWLQLALVTWLPAALFPDVMSVAPMRVAMLLVTAVSAVLLYVLARRLGLRRWAAALGMALFGLSPLSVVLQREIFLDNIAVLWILLAFCLAASPRRHLWHHFGAGLAAAVAVLSKETMLVVLPALLLTMWRHTHRDTRKFAVTGAITACVLTGLAYPLFALLNHELFPGDGHVSLIDGIKYQMSRAGSGFILDDRSGAHAVLRSWLYYDRVLPLAGLAAAVLLLAAARWSRTGRALAGPATAAVTLALVALRPSGYLPAMYVIQMLPFLALSLAGAAAAALQPLRAPIQPSRATFQPLRRLRSGGPGAEPLEETGRGGTGAKSTPRRPALIRRAIATAAAITTTAAIAPHWYDATHTALTTDTNAPYRAAAHWLRDRTNVPEPSRTRVLADDAIWLDLVHAGYRPGTGAVWFYKADLDPAITKTLPRGWRDVDYVVASPTVRRDAPTLPLVKAALVNSETVASFGEGDGRIEIRRVRAEAR